MSPPTGRAANPTANVANDASVATNSDSPEKKILLKTSAADVLKRKKSYHSSTDPTTAAMALRFREFRWGSRSGAVVG